MKVLLVQAWLGGAESPVYPIGLASIAATLNGHDVKVFDPNVSARPYEDLKEITQSFAPDVAGVSLRNIDSTNKRVVVFYYERLREMIDVIKSAAPHTKIAVGGAGFSMYAEEIMRDEPRIDYGVYLEGEEVFNRLLDRLAEPEKTASVYYRANGSVAFSGPGVPPSFNRLPAPAMDLVPVESYAPFRDSIGVETKRGCALNCIYCIYGFLNGREYRLKDPSRIVDEIEILVNRHGAQKFTFVDSVFNIPKSHAEAIMREMIKRRVQAKWSAWFNEKGFTREFAELAKEAGCSNFIMSPDGFSNESLKALGKNISRKDILEAYSVLRDMDGVEVSYNFFKNPPGQTLPNFIAMALFCVRAKRAMGRRVHFEFNSIRVEPHTRLHKIALDEGLVSPADSLLKPCYYTNRKTKYIETALNFLLSLKGK
ncbi:MAG: cobalamin B12-binding domain-containing protein [Nitrospinae bacterium]|nr:cobalamin B12-binding domain-containing protein [Nitrospinota bacterium]